MNPARNILLAALAAVALGTPSVEAAPAAARKTEASSRKRPRTPKREMRRGLPVLRSRDTPGRTREVQPDDVGGGSPADAPDPGTPPPTTAAPADHIELSVDAMRQGNASLDFEGRMWGSFGTFETNVLKIVYPMAAAAGRELTLQCDGLFFNDVTVSTSAQAASNPLAPLTIFDEFVIKKKNDGTSRKSIKLLIDTTVPAQYVDDNTFRILITSYPTTVSGSGGTGATNVMPPKPMGERIERCTLDLAPS